MGVNGIDPLGLFDDEVMAMAFYAKYGEDGQDIYRYMYRKGYLVYKGQFDSLIPWRKKNIDIADTGAGKRNLWLDDDLDEEEAADLLWDYLNNSTMSHEYFLDKAANDPEALANLHMRFQRAGMDTAERTRRILRLAGDVGASFIPGEGFVETITGETPSGEKLATWERALASAPLVGALKQIKTANKGRKIIDLAEDAGKVARKGKKLEGQLHHPITRKIWRALERHPKLKGKYKPRDSRFITKAKDLSSHHGYQTWHRDLDDDIVEWIKENEEAIPEIFESFLNNRYNQSDLVERFPDGL